MDCLNQLTYIIIYFLIRPWAPARGGGVKSRCSYPGKNIYGTTFFLPHEGFFFLFSVFFFFMEAFSHYGMGAFFSLWRFFSLCSRAFFTMCGSFLSPLRFFGLPLPSQKFRLAPMNTTVVIVSQHLYSNLIYEHYLIYRRTLHYILK